MAINCIDDGLSFQFEVNDSMRNALNQIKFVVHFNFDTRCCINTCRKANKADESDEETDQQPSTFHGSVIQAIHEFINP